MRNNHFLTFFCTKKLWVTKMCFCTNPPLKISQKCMKICKKYSRFFTLYKKVWKSYCKSLNTVQFAKNTAFWYFLKVMFVGDHFSLKYCKNLLIIKHINVNFFKNFKFETILYMKFSYETPTHKITNI